MASFPFIEASNTGISWDINGDSVGYTWIYQLYPIWVESYGCGANLGDPPNILRLILSIFRQTQLWNSRKHTKNEFGPAVTVGSAGETHEDQTGEIGSILFKGLNISILWKFHIAMENHP